MPSYVVIDTGREPRLVLVVEGLTSILPRTPQPTETQAWLAYAEEQREKSDTATRRWRFALERIAKTPAPPFDTEPPE